MKENNKQFETRKTCSNSEDRRQMRITGVRKMVKATDFVEVIMETDITLQILRESAKNGCPITQIPQDEAFKYMEIWCAGFGTAMHLVEEGVLSSQMLAVEIGPKGGG